LCSSSPSEYHRLFGTKQLPTIPSIPEDISFIFSLPPEPPETRKLAFDFQDDWIIFPLPVYHHLEQVLAYTPSQRLFTSVQYCWEKLDEIISQVGKMIDKIMNDSRHRKEDPRPRPRACLANLIHVETDSIYLLKSCHSALHRSACGSCLFERSEKLWFAALTRSAKRLALVPVRS